MDMKGVIF